MNITEFQQSRFGLFIHWGIYAICARGEWVRSNEEMKDAINKYNLPLKQNNYYAKKALDELNEI